LTQWEGSVTRCGGVSTSIGGEAASRRRKGGEDVSWADVGQKIKKIHAVNSTVTNG
jgi:hypothetical protein